MRFPVVSEVYSSQASSRPPLRLVVRLSSGSVICTSTASPLRAPGGIRAVTSTSEVVLPGSSSSFLRLSNPCFFRLFSSMIRHPPGVAALPVPGSP